MSSRSNNIELLIGDVAREIKDIVRKGAYSLLGNLTTNKLGVVVQ